MKSMSCLGAMVGLLLFAVSAIAQDEAEDALRNVPRIQIAAGYSSLRDVDLHQSIPGGWFFFSRQEHQRPARYHVRLERERHCDASSCVPSRPRCALEHWCVAAGTDILQSR